MSWEWGDNILNDESKFWIEAALPIEISEPEKTNEIIRNTSENVDKAMENTELSHDYIPLRSKLWAGSGFEKNSNNVTARQNNDRSQSRKRRNRR